MNHFRHLLYLLFLSGITVLTNCQTGIAANDLDPAQPWSVRMAGSVMTRYPRLTDMDLKFHGRSRPKWQYDIAMLAEAIDRLGKVDRKYETYMKDYIDYFISPDGGIFNYALCDYNLDKIRPGNNLIILYRRTGEEKYGLAIEQLVGQLKDQPHNPDGGFWHKAVYPYQMWLDGIYMGTPFMAGYAGAFDDPEWFDEAVRQITVIEEHTRDPRTGLLYHGYDASRGMKWSDDETGCSPHFWGRAMGWYMMALVDVLDFLPESHPGREKVIGILQRTSEALAGVRDPDTGLWYQVLDMGGKPGNYLEASASCMFVYALAKGARKGYLEDTYRSMAASSFDSIIKEFIEVEENGLVNITHCCFAAGLGGLDYRSGSYDYYINERRGMNDSKSVGPFIMAAIELNR
jgi:unsaturated rhamnogalacturonyl hydrolase